MATVVLQGGLGNQLFQYAVGRALSLRTKSPLYLEISRLKRSPHGDLPSRSFQLSNFKVQGEVVQRPVEADTFLTLRLKLFSLIGKAYPNWAARFCKVHKDQTPHQFAPYVLTLPGDVLLFGYYQSEKYFREIRATLLQEISLRKPPTGQNRKWRTRIRKCNSVSVHIRRGDYKTQGWLLPDEYYRSAIAKMRTLNGTVDLFFFSDDMKWVRNHIETLLPADFPMTNVNFVECNCGRDGQNDLHLMRSCSHNIIANSSFSWWGAWLNRHDDKIVLAPAYWLRSPITVLDVIPEPWEIIEW